VASADDTRRRREFEVKRHRPGPPRAADDAKLSQADWLRILGPARKSWADNFLVPAITNALLAERRNRKKSAPTAEKE
jgi:hypothetical protein